MGRTKRFVQGDKNDKQSLVKHFTRSTKKSNPVKVAKSKKKQPAQMVEVIKKTKPKKKRRKGTKIRQRYAVSIFRVLRQIYKDLKISKNAMDIMECFMDDIFERIASESTIFTKYNKRKTMTPMDIEGATRLVLNGNLTKHAIHCGATAVIKYFNSTF